MANKGFTLIEVLIAIFVLGTIATFGLFASMDAYARGDVRSERATFIALLTRARTLAMTNVANAAHGVCYRDPDYILFKAAYDPSNIEAIVPKGKSITISGLPACSSGSELVFAQFSALATPLDITLSNPTESVTISINSEGTILW